MSFYNIYVGPNPKSFEFPENFSIDFEELYALMCSVKRSNKRNMLAVLMLL